MQNRGDEEDMLLNAGNTDSRILEQLRLTL